nr:3-phosphoglycerate kinase [Tanacetum cinerariifolium]
VTKQHNKDCKKLLRLIGVPIIEDPTEAEAQCSALCRANRHVYAVASEDIDSLTFRAPKFVMEFDVSKVLEGLGLMMDQFIDLCILCGYLWYDGFEAYPSAWLNKDYSGEYKQRKLDIKWSAPNEEPKDSRSVLHYWRKISLTLQHISLLGKAKANGVSMLLPSDVVIADKLDPDANSKVVPASSIPDGWMGVDIGPDSIKTFCEYLDTAKAVMWNGPLGVFDFDKFATGTV